MKYLIILITSIILLFGCTNNKHLNKDISIKDSLTISFPEMKWEVLELNTMRSDDTLVYYFVEKGYYVEYEETRQKTTITIFRKDTTIYFNR